MNADTFKHGYLSARNLICQQHLSISAHQAKIWQRLHEGRSGKEVPRLPEKGLCSWAGEKSVSARMLLENGTGLLTRPWHTARQQELMVVAGFLGVCKL